MNIRDVLTEVIERIAPDVHDSWMAGQLTHGRTTAESRHGTGELMVPYDDLAEVDKDDDRRIVAAVLASMAKLPPMAVMNLMDALRADDALLAELRVMFGQVDPPPAGLVDRCLDRIAGEDGQ